VATEGVEEALGLSLVLRHDLHDGAHPAQQLRAVRVVVVLVGTGVLLEQVGQLLAVGLAEAQGVTESHVDVLDAEVAPPLLSGGLEVSESNAGSHSLCVSFCADECGRVPPPPSTSAN